MPKTGARPLTDLEKTWGGKFQAGSKADIEKAFSEPGSRGIVYIKWNPKTAHVFNVENVDGNLRFIDGQPTPPLTDASNYFSRGYDTQFMRLDDKPTPPDATMQPYVVHHAPPPEPLKPPTPGPQAEGQIWQAAKKTGTQFAQTAVSGAHAGATSVSSLLNTAESQNPPDSAP